jgi:hypothetical protein
VGEWYTVGLAVGLGVAAGVLAAGIVPRRFVAPIVAAAIGFGLGILVDDWGEAIGGVLGGASGGFGAAQIVKGALRRGGTRGGLAVFSGLGAVVAAGLAFVPVVGYLQAVALPLLALRLRSREPERHAGLRTLARD